MKKRFLCICLAAVLLLGLCPAAGAAYTEMAFSDQLVEYIKQGEGLSTKLYADSTGWYIGYGCLCNPADYPNGITEAEAETLLRSVMQQQADAIDKFLKKYDIAVTQGQYDAMCAMSYAFGPSWMNTGNRLPGYLIAGIENYTDQQIGAAFAAWCHVGEAVNQVALRRRIMETKMFLYADYSFTTEGWNWLIMDANGGENALSDVTIYPSGKAYGVLPEASKPNCYLAGWQTEDGTVLKAADTVSGDHRVTALWSATPVAADPAPSPTPTPAPAPTPAPTPVPETADPDTAAFPDVPEDAWYYGYVTALAAAGALKGYEDGSFRPANDVSWGEALKLVLLAAGYPDQTPVEVAEGEPPAHWASGYLAYAEKMTFIPADTVADPDAKITRDELADLCAAALELSAAASGPSPYADSSRKSVLALYEAGIMEGSIEGGQRLYKGTSLLNRAEICAVLVRVKDYVARTLILFAGRRIPIDYDLKPNGYADAGFTTAENGRISYADGETEAHYGIDVSEHQGAIDWQKVAADGIEFAYIRCGRRSYGSKATLNEDEYFRDNVAGALAAGLDVGIYFFSQALNVDEALEEAAYTMELIRGYDIALPVVFDWEPIGRTQNCDGKTVTDCAVAFCDAVAAAGYRPMIYFNLNMAYLKLDLHRVQQYDNWLARYASPVPQYKYDFQIWQYGSSGSVAGISGNVDMNIAFADLRAESRRQG